MPGHKEPSRKPQHPDNMTTYNAFAAYAKRRKDEDEDENQAVVEQQPAEQPEPPGKNYDASPFIELLEPKRDEEHEKRLKRVASANSIGDALRTVIQAVGASQGANVTPLDTSTTTNATKKLQFLDDKFKDEDHKYKLLKYQDQLREINMTREDDRFKDQRAHQVEDRESNQAHSEKMQGAQFGQQDKHAEAGRLHSEQQAKLNRDHAEKMQKAGFGQQSAMQNKLFDQQVALKNMDYTKAIEAIQAKAAAERANGGGDVHFVLYDKDLKPVHAINESQLNTILGKIMEVPEASQEFELIKAQYGNNMSAEQKKYLVAKYWSKVQDQLGGLMIYDLAGNNKSAASASQPDLFQQWITGDTIAAPGAAGKEASTFDEWLEQQ